MKKEIKIESIQDIIDKVPEDRLNYFLKDLESYLKFSYSQKEFIDLLPKWAIEKYMIWIDDGKNDFKWVNISIKD